MSASDEFREHLRAGNLVKAMNLAIARAVELEITTWVSSDRAPEDAPTPDCTIKTRLNIVEGEVENEVGSQLIGNGPYRELREFHAAQVQSAQQIIQQNLESLQQVFTILTVASSRGLQSSNPAEALPPRATERLDVEHRRETY